MVSEEYSKTRYYFWSDCLKFLATIPAILMFVCLWAYYHGNHRAAYIQKYNNAVTDWVNGGRDEFGKLNFTLLDTATTVTYREVDQKSGIYYPVRDLCKEKKDPKEGCTYTDALYYDEDIPWMTKHNYFTIWSPDGSILRQETEMVGSLNYTRDAKQLGCKRDMDRCPMVCDEMNGTWSPQNATCNIQVYVDSICYRVTKENGKWVLDTKNSHKLPKNEAFDAYPSDGLGCDYGNNWNSIHYGKTPRGDIAMQLRSAKDSYLFASAYTRGCSNDHLEPAKCFGPTQREEEMGVFVCLHICFGLAVLEILAFITLWIIRRVAYKRQVNAQNNSSAKDALLSV